MDKGKKRERNANYSLADTDRLISLVHKYIDIVENKKSDAVTWQEKERTWKAIEAEYNCSEEVEIYRDAKHLKLKYEAIKRDIRKKCSAIRSELYKSSSVNKAFRLSSLEEKVRLMLMSVVDAGESTYDSDPLDLGPSYTHEELNGTSDSMQDSTDYLDISMAASETLEDNKANILLLEENQHPNPPSPQNRHADNADIPLPSTSCQVDIEVVEMPPKKWAESKPKAPRPFNKLSDARLEIVQLRKTLLEEELQEKKIKNLMMEMEMHYKKELHELEKEERLLKIRILKRELENKPKAKRPFDKFAEEKLEIVQLQKTLLEEELQEKRIKKQMIEMDMNYKKELHEL